jgi:UDP-N-acetyl-D-glucosamine dehydrogenase
MKLNVAVIGQGYVGLPLSISIAESGMNVIGIDKNQLIVNELNLGNTLVEDVENNQLKSQIESGNYQASTDYSKIKGCSVILICVPTPLLGHKPDLSYLLDAVKSLGAYLKEGDLVIVESTIEPGTTTKIVIPLLERESKMSREKFHVVFSPERIDPTNNLWNLKNTPKLLAGFTKEAGKMAVAFYSNFIDTIVECDSIEVAESAKLLENSFRLVNISFINEFSIFCQKLGVDVNQVIKAATTKPYGFMPFYPGIGVGGHCIPVDPLYLANKAREIGAPTRFIDLADQVNQEMPEYFVSRAREKIGGLKEKKILVIGVSYKPNVADVRESPVAALILGLRQKGAKVSWHDDLVETWNGEKSEDLSEYFDLAILATPHDYLDLAKLGEVPILNTRESI